MQNSLLLTAGAAGQKGSGMLLEGQGEQIAEKPFQEGNSSYRQDKDIAKVGPALCVSYTYMYIL